MIFVSANSHRASDKLRGMFPEVECYHRWLSGEPKGPHYSYLLTEEQFNRLKKNPITGCARTREQNPAEWGKCWKSGIKH